MLKLPFHRCFELQHSLDYIANIACTVSSFKFRNTKEINILKVSRC